MNLGNNSTGRFGIGKNGTIKIAQICYTVFDDI